MNYLMLFILSLVGVLAGSSLVIKGLKSIAKIIRVSDIFIGLTIGSIGTSLPEIATNINASIQGVTDIGIGNIIGSCLSQITLIIGLIALMEDLKIGNKTIKREGVWLFIAILNMFLVSWDGIIKTSEGVMLILVYLIYLGTVIWEDKIKIKSNKSLKIHKTDKKAFITSFATIIIGFGVLIISSNLFVKSAADIAELFGIRQVLVGIFMVGIGTSLPELLIAAQGVINGAKNISIGVLIGSNITDPLFSLGLGTLFTPITVTKNILFFDIPILIAFTALTLFFFYKKYKYHFKIKGVTLISLFLLYSIIRILL